jgi:RNA polymerase subunit RPABC4/transcription elongation factor Spt4
MATVTVSTEIICPNCGKRMVKKNWKDHARYKHAMTEETIQTKYERLLASSSNSSLDKPTPIIMRNFFSTKKLAITVSDSEQQNLNDNIGNTEVIIIDNQTDTLAKSTDNSTPTGTIYQFF